jgi:hypothetical protein
MTNLKNKKFSKEDEVKGGFLGIPNLGIFKKEEKKVEAQQTTEPSTPEDKSALSKSVDSSVEENKTSSTVESSVEEIKTSDSVEPSVEEKKKICLEAADKKAKEAAEDKKKCEKDFPRKKLFGFIGGKKRRSKSKKGKSKSSHKKKRATKKASH